MTRRSFNIELDDATYQAVAERAQQAGQTPEQVLADLIAVFAHSGTVGHLTTYTVQRGDTLAKIANQVFNPHLLNRRHRRRLNRPLSHPRLPHHPSLLNLNPNRPRLQNPPRRLQSKRLIPAHPFRARITTPYPLSVLPPIVRLTSTAISIWLCAAIPRPVVNSA